MAKHQDPQPPPATPPVPPAPPPVAEAPKGEQDKDARIAELLKQQEELRARLSELGAAAPAGREAKAGTYRVSLAGVPCFRTTAHVEPKDVRFTTDELKGVLAKLGTKRTAAYDAVEVYCEGRKEARAKDRPTAGLDELARARYLKERGLELDPNFFRVRVLQGEPTDALEIPAGSPWEAEAIFREYCGVTASSGAFTTVIVEPPPEGGERGSQPGPTPPGSEGAGEGEAPKKEGSGWPGRKT
jgi:hypothetical protein